MPVLSVIDGRGQIVFFYLKNKPYLHVSQSSEGYYAKLCGKKNYGC